MRYRVLGRTGVKVSGLAFGTMSFGGDADEAMSAALFARCRDVGINLFDCADVYNGGRAEEILGRLVADCRDEIVLASKGHFPTGDGVNARGSSRYHLVRTVEGSLRRLGTDRIDLWYLHRFDDDTDLEETLRAVEHLVAQGKILYPAVSNFAAWQVVDALGIAALRGFQPIVALQPMYNLVKRAAEIELLPMAHAKGLAVFPYSPLGGGLLSGKYAPDTRPADGRLTHNERYMTRYGDRAYYEQAAAFTALAHEFGHSPAALAVAWVASHPAVTAPLLGARDVDQLDDLLGASLIELSADRRERISSLTPPPPPATDRNEEASARPFGKF